MSKRPVFLISLILMILGTCTSLWAHCEMPCGIYDDEMRVKMIAEDATTIEKAMKSIQELGQKTPVDYNQLVRWIVTKEAHAEKIQQTVSQYFMTQRIHFNDTNYDKKLAGLHQLLVYAMKCKQTTDLGNVQKLRDALKAFETLYFETAH